MRLATVGLLLCALAAPALARDGQDKRDRSKLFQQLVDCRTVADPQQRLACYDRQVAALDTAESSKEVVILDKSQVAETRRSVFGLTLPKLKIFGGGDDDELKEIQSQVVAFGYNADGRLKFTIAEGNARWVQNDDRPMALRLKPGTKVTIRAGTLGSYFARFEGAAGIRVVRVN